jgi:hypothetical protein
MTALYHYTTLTCLPAIHDSGELSLDRDGRSLWFSSRKHWEPAAAIRTADGFMTFSDQHEAFGCARFVASASLLQTLGYPLVPALLPDRDRAIIEMINTIERRMQRAGLGPDYYGEKFGSHRDWYRSYKAVSVRHVRLEVWDQGKWRPASLPVAAELLRPAINERGRFGGQWVVLREARTRLAEALKATSSPERAAAS